MKFSGLFLLLVLIPNYGLALNLISASAPDCAINHTYGVTTNDSPSFIIRSGYSRDNDDPEEGNYETAVFDLELVGRTLADGQTCLYLVDTITLSSEVNNANAWSNQFFVRRMGAWKMNGTNWQNVEGYENGAGRLSVLNQTQASYLSNEKYIPFEAPRPEGKVALFNYTFLGKLNPGQYMGRVFLQGAPFTNTDDSNYNQVRHVLQWNISLENGKLVTPKEIVKSNYLNQVRFILPKWHFVGPKKHSVKLMWRDVIENGVRADLYSALKSSNPPSDEVFGRCRSKSHR